MQQKLICVFLYTITRAQDACFMASGYESVAGYFYNDVQVKPFLEILHIIS